MSRVRFRTKHSIFSAAKVNFFALLLSQVQIVKIDHQVPKNYYTGRGLSPTQKEIARFFTLAKEKFMCFVRDRTLSMHQGDVSEILTTTLANTIGRMEDIATL